jgi:predicted amidophosphoribosyltransferase
VFNAFEVCRPEAVHGRTVVLVDDVITTGATLNACAKVLKESGAESVVGLSLARPRMGLTHG